MMRAVRFVAQLGLTPDELDALTAEQYIGTDYVQGAELGRADREALQRR